MKVIETTRITIIELSDSEILLLHLVANHATKSKDKTTRLAGEVLVAKLTNMEVEYVQEQFSAPTETGSVGAIGRSVEE